MFGEGEMMTSLERTNVENGIDGENIPLSVGESSESSLFGEELSGANPSTAIGGAVQNAGAMAGKCPRITKRWRCFVPAICRYLGDREFNGQKAT